MKEEDKHRWQFDGINKKMAIPKVKNPQQYTCLDCGCQKIIYSRWNKKTNKPTSFEIFGRSGITLGMKEPTCIKEDIENAKIID